jgi:hypothetical protein
LTANPGCSANTDLDNGMSPMGSEPSTWEIKAQGLKLVFDAESGEFTYLDYKVEAPKSESDKARLTLSPPMAPEMVYTSFK